MQAIRSNWFLLGLVAFCLLSVALLFLYSKSAIHFAINGYHNSPADYFFSYFTFLGDGWFAGALIVVFLFLSYKNSVLLFCSFLFSSALAQFLKKVIFPHTLRPVSFLEDPWKLHLVDGEQINIIQSFPSGHTTTAFAVFCMLSFFTENNFLRLLFLVTALLVAYSRMYLSQHFLEDVLAGAVLGSLVSISIYLLLENKVHSWGNRSLLNHKR